MKKREHRVNFADARVRPGFGATGAERLGVSDLPTQPSGPGEIPTLDLLEIQNYYRGLAEFVEHCVTPMTVAVQGEWGSGKTSALYNIEQLVSPRVKVVYVNTWQYALFGTADQMVFSVLRKMIGTFQVAGEMQDEFASARESNEYRERFNKIWAAVSRLAYSSAHAIAMGHGVDFAAGVQHFNSLAEAPSQSQGADTHEELFNLREDFAQLVEDYCKHYSLEKVIFLVDDMDRLEPAKAVELLEVFKVLLDVPLTTFILALDFKVVELGVSDRFGGSDGFTRGKARSFFDKIVQVPFNMPLSSYQPDALILEQLESLKIPTDDKTVRKYAEAVRWSVGNNPRAIKRLFNAFTLTRVIADEGARAEDDITLAIFLLICVQVAYPDLGEDVADFVELLDARRQGINLENHSVTRLLTLDPDDGFEEDDLDRWGVELKNVGSFSNFVFQLQDMFVQTAADDGALDTSDWETLVHAHRLSSVTSVVSDTSASEEIGSEVMTVADKLRYRDFEIDGDPAKRPAILILENQIKKLVAADRDLFNKGIVLAPLNPPQSPNFTGYVADSMEELSAKSSRNRPKFLDFRQNKQSLQIGFGVRNLPLRIEDGESLTPDSVKKFFDERWHVVIDKVATEFEPVSDPSSKSVEFGYTFEASFAPIVVKGIRSEEEVAKFVDILPDIYRAATSGSGRSFLMTT